VESKTNITIIPSEKLKGRNKLVNVDIDGREVLNINEIYYGCRGHAVA
jgi:hypothetical protein